jgi:hypothetical protein
VDAGGQVWAQRCGENKQHDVEQDVEQDKQDVDAVVEWRMTVVLVVGHLMQRPTEKTNNCPTEG